MDKKQKVLLGELSKIDDWFMVSVYAMNILLEIGYCYVMLGTDYTVPDHSAFFWFYAVTSGVIIFLSVLLLDCIFRRRSAFKRMYLLLWLAFFQLCAIAADLAYAAMHGEWWADGYVFFILELLLTAIYLRRYFVLRKAKGATASGS